RADGALDRADGRGHRGARLPRPGRSGQPDPTAPVPVRHRPAHRRGLRPTVGHARLGRAAPPRPPPAPALPAFPPTLRSVAPGLLETLRTADAMVVTVLAAGGSRPATAQ